MQSGHGQASTSDYAVLGTVSVEMCKRTVKLELARGSGGQYLVVESEGDGLALRKLGKLQDLGPAVVEVVQKCLDR